MAALIGTEPSDVRSYPQEVKRYLSVAPKIILFSAQIAGGAGIPDANDPDVYGVWFDAISHGVYMLHYDNEEGDAAACGQGFIIDIGTTPGGHDVGTMYLRDAIDTVNKRIPVNETAYGQVPITDNNYITVRYLGKPEQSIVRLQTTATGSNGQLTNFIEFHNYDEQYTSQNNEILPVANINKPSDTPSRRLAAKSAGWAVDGFFRVTLTAIHSYSMNGNSLSYAWDIADCTLISGDLDDAEITIDCPPGYRLITLVVTDAVTDISSKPRYHPVLSHDDTFPPVEFGTRGFTITSDVRGEGRRMSFDIFGQSEDATEEIFPKNTLCIYWEEPYFGNEPVPETYIDQFTGWIYTKNYRPVLDGGTVTIDVYGVEGWLSEAVTGFGVRITDTGHLPTRWFEMEDITVRRMIHYLLREYSTTLQYANLYMTDLPRHDRAEDLGKDKLFNQLKTIAKAFACRIGVDSNNGIWLVQEPVFLVDRSGVPTITEITSDDITSDGISVTERESKVVGVVDGTGSAWDGASAKPTIFAARSPGISPGTGEGQESFFWRVDDQDMLDYFTGQLYARVNSKYQSLSIVLIGNMDIFEPCWHEFITIDYAEPNIASYVIPDTTSFLITQVSVAHSNSTGSVDKRISLTLEELTTGIKAEIVPIVENTDIVPDDISWETQPALPPVPLDMSTDPIADFTPEPTPENPTPAALPLGFAITGLDKKLCRTYHALDEDVTWQDITPPTETGTLIDYKAIWNEMSETMHCYAVYRTGTGASKFKVWKSDVYATNIAWVADTTEDIVGDTSEGVKGSIDFNDTTNLTAFAYLCADGVRCWVKESGIWDLKEVGDVTFEDDTVATRDIQLLVDDDKIVVCGATGDKQYKLFIAVDDGAFAEIDDSPVFDTPVSSLARDGTTLYAAAWNADGTGGDGTGGNTRNSNETSLSPEDCFTSQQTVAAAANAENGGNGYDSGIDVNTGDIVHTLADVADVWEGGAGPYNADGWVGSVNGSAYAPTDDLYCLLWRIGTSGAWTKAGLETEFTAEDTGRLYFLCNDVPGAYADNSGTIDVEVSIIANVPFTVIIGTGTGPVVSIVDTDLLALVDDESVVVGRRIEIHFDVPVKEVNFDYNYGGGSTGDPMLYRFGTSGFTYVSQIGTANITSDTGETILIVDLGYSTVPTVYDDSPAFIENITAYASCDSGLADPNPVTNNSRNGFPGQSGSSSLGLEWDLTDDDPKQFDESQGYFEIQWNFEDSEDKRIEDGEWFLNIRYNSDLDTTPTGSVLRMRWKITMKEVDQPPDFTTGELVFTKAASTLAGTGPYTRTVTSGNMLTGLELDGVQLEYLKCRVDLVVPAINLVDYDSGETLASWEIYTTPYGDSGSPSIEYGTLDTAGNQVYRVAAYNTAPVWTDITPTTDNSDEGAAGRSARYKYGLAIDAITNTTIYMCGYNETDSWLIKSIDSGDNWTTVEMLNADWVFVSDTVFLYGGTNVLFLALNGLENSVSRVGDLTRFGASPLIKHVTLIVSG